MNAVAVALAGGLGAVLRVLLDGVLGARWGASVRPVLLVNVLGSLLLGLVVGAVLYDGAPSALRLAVGTGFCGGFTTFSTVSVASVRLAEQGLPGRAAANAVGSLVATLCAAGVGLALAAL